MAGTDSEKILESVKYMLTKKPPDQTLFGDGQASVKIVEILKEHKIV